MWWQTWIFNIVTPVFSVTYPLEVILICWFGQDTFLIIVNVENSCAALFFWGGQCYIFFFKIIWIESSKEQAENNFWLTLVF